MFDGTSIGAYGLTEPSAGSDDLSAKTTAVLSDDGKHYILNGEKVFITNGGWADVYTVFAKVDGEKFTAFILERDTPGFTQGPEYDKMGMRGSNTAELFFENCAVPEENILGKPGDGAAILMSGLDYERVVLAAGPVGIMAAAMDQVIPYIHDRKQFGKSIGEFQIMQGKIGEHSIT